MRLRQGLACRKQPLRQSGHDYRGTRHLQRAAVALEGFDPLTSLKERRPDTRMIGIGNRVSDAYEVLEAPPLVDADSLIRTAWGRIYETLPSGRCCIRPRDCSLPTSRYVGFATVKRYDRDSLISDASDINESRSYLVNGFCNRSFWKPATDECRNARTDAAKFEVRVAVT